MIIRLHGRLFQDLSPNKTHPWLVNLKVFQCKCTMKNGIMKRAISQAVLKYKDTNYKY